MRVFIDESGNFVSSSTPRISCVSGLVIQDQFYERVRRQFLGLKKQFGIPDEIKGRELTENQIAKVIGVLRTHDAFVAISSIDMSQHPDSVITPYKAVQADKIVENLTNKHHESMKDEYVELRQRVLALSNQLFVQLQLLIEVIQQTLTNASLYLSQVAPKELGSFDWQVDAKNSAVGKTEYEALWTSLLGPILQSNFRMAKLTEGDYSYFERFEIGPNEMSEFQRSLYSDNPAGAGKVREIISEQLTFHDSELSVGLQLVDIISSAYSRAMNGTLRLKGWRHLGALLFEQPQFAILNLDKSFTPVMSISHKGVLRHLMRTRKIILPT